MDAQNSGPQTKPEMAEESQFHSRRTPTITVTLICCMTVIVVAVIFAVAYDFAHPAAVQHHVNGNFQSVRNAL